ncbi:MAG: hypothetical protein ABID79_00165 [Elusimicrobiota bacterium]
MEKEKQSEKDYAEIIEILNKHKVDYLIVGAYAVIQHTKISRYTKDIDFWIRDTKDNAEKCSKVIKEFSGLNVSPEDLLAKDNINYIGVEPNRIDFFNAQGDLDFNTSFKNKCIGHFRDKKAFYISIDDLIKAKRYYLSKDDRDILGQEKDLKDIKRLGIKKEKRK